MQVEKEKKQPPTKYHLGTCLPPEKTRHLLYLPNKGIDLMHEGNNLNCRFSVNTTMMVFSRVPSISR